jgi:hypothetical protein
LLLQGTLTQDLRAQVFFDQTLFPGPLITWVKKIDNKIANLFVHSGVNDTSEMKKQSLVNPHIFDVQVKNIV